MNCGTTNFSKYLVYLLQPIVKEPKLLYTNIPNQESIKAVNKFRKSFKKFKEKSVSKRVIMTFLKSILAFYLTLSSLSTFFNFLKSHIQVANMEYYEKTINNNPNKLYIFEKVIKEQIKKKNKNNYF